MVFSSIHQRLLPINSYKPLIGSHRGINYSKKIPENTIKSFENNPSCDYIEVDCQLTKDNQLILFHDQTILSTPINMHLLSDLKKHHPWLITLDILLEEICSNSTSPLYNKALYLELKYYEKTLERKNLFINTLLSLLTTHEINKTNVIIVSFDSDLLDLIHNSDPSYFLGLNVSLNTADSENYKLTEKALKKIQTIPKRIALCPHINEIDHMNLSTLPKLVWEGANERAILEKLSSFKSKQELLTWCVENNIVGFTTNNVAKVSQVLNA
jgi:glycerophosphoryl diester phosphodiesterase